MQQGDIVEYRIGRSSDIGTVSDVSEDMVTIMDIEEPKVTWNVSKGRIVNVIKRSGIE